VHSCSAALLAVAAAVVLQLLARVIYRNFGCRAAAAVWLLLEAQLNGFHQNRANQNGIPAN